MIVLFDDEVLRQIVYKQPHRKKSFSLNGIINFGLKILKFKTPL